jgi:hypothetical protein
MDDDALRDRLQEHADAVVRGDMDAVVNDFAEALRPQVPQIAQALPQPVRSAEILSAEAGDDINRAEIRYSGDDRAVTIRSSWQDENGRLVLVQAEPTGP